jgi:hypothetical protein
MPLMKWSIIVVAAFAIYAHQPCLAQQNRIDSLFAKGDTTAVMDSLMKGFDAFVDSISQPRSFFSVSIGVGNRSFSIKNNSLNTQESTTNQLSLLPSVGYYHKSGLGLSVSGFLSTLNNKLTLYQYAITPSYDYISDKLTAGISYTRYLGKDMAIQNSSPYENDWYGYLNFLRNTWRFGLSMGYATGKFTDQLSYRDSVLRFNVAAQRPDWLYFQRTIDSDNEIRDFSLSLSGRKDFEWYDVIAKNDNLTISVTLYLVSGASSISTTSNQNVTARKIELARFRRTYQSTDGNGFQFQSTALSASLFYNLGKFNIQPVWFMDYYFPESDKKFNQVFSVTVGLNF